jgi:UDP-2,4-diacetamido-2,4,6-trideoxy-beta-L-altropyranose hydrolase
MNIVFRVDSSNQIGAGHLMRCITLALKLKQHGCNVKFICADLIGNLISLINFPVLKLSKDKNFQSNDFYLKLLGSTQEQDAKQSIKIIPKNIDLLVIDHYALDAIWHQKLRPFAHKIMVIDDLANKQFDCDLLLNQNLGIQRNKYKKKAPESCKLLLGCDYALLREEFLQLRKKAIAKRKNTKNIKNILISMGGSDIKNATYRILRQLSDEYNIVVVLGKESPHNDVIINYAKSKNIKVIVSAHNMAELMFNADLSIGASGSTNWERLFLGLPSLVFTVAENQQEFAKKLDDLRLIRLLGDASDKKSIVKISKNLLAINDLNDWSDRCFKSCKSDGASKIVEIVLGDQVLKE